MSIRTALVFFLIVICVINIDAGKYGGGGHRSSSGSGWRGGSSRGGGSSRSSSGGGYKPSTSGSSGGWGRGRTTSTGGSYSPPSTGPSGRWTPPKPTNTGPINTSSKKNTDATTGLIESERGGHRNPGSFPGNNPYKPSAPPLDQANRGTANIPTDTKPRNPYAPSAPPAVEAGIPKSTAPTSNQGQPWGNPHLGSSNPPPVPHPVPNSPYPNSSPGNPPYPIHPPLHNPQNSAHPKPTTIHRNSSSTFPSPSYPPNGPHSTSSAPYPGQSRPGQPSVPHRNVSSPYPIPSNPSTGPHITSSAPYPGQPSHPYPGQPPYPYPGQPPYPYPGQPSHPYPGQSPYPGPQTRPYPGQPPYPIQPHPYPYPQHPGQPTGNPYHPSMTPSGFPVGNPYQPHPVGNHYQPGQPVYQPQPQYLAQPASQPYIPGQTIIVVPGQQSSGGGRGIDNMIAEALVFSTVNAGVNRLINPHHHTYTPGPTGGTATSTTTHVTINNQYYMYPNGTAVSVPPGSAPPPGTYPDAANNLPGTNPFGTNSPGHNPSGTNSPGNYQSGTNTPANHPSRTNSPGTHSPGTNAGTHPSGTPNSPNQNKNTPDISTNGGTVNNNKNSNPNTDYAVQYAISDEDLYKITEELFSKENFDVDRYITLNLQGRAKPLNLSSPSLELNDEAFEPLLHVHYEAYEIPSIDAIRALYDSYTHNGEIKETISTDRRKKENLFLDVLLNTNTVATAMKWLTERRLIGYDDFERKETLRHIWFDTFMGSSCGFERAFMSEKYYTNLMGITDWIYFNYQESLKNMNYLGYYEKKDLGSKASLLKLNVKMDGISRPNVTIFIGTLPELQMSLYTICFYARPNSACPVSLGGTKFYIYTHSFRYYGKDLIDIAMPIF